MNLSDHLRFAAMLALLSTPSRRAITDGNRWHMDRLPDDHPHVTDRKIAAEAKRARKLAKRAQLVKS